MATLSFSLGGKGSLCPTFEPIEGYSPAPAAAGPGVQVLNQQPAAGN